MVLALTEFLRKEKVVGAYLEFFGEGAAALTSATAPPSPTWPGIRRHRGDVLHRQQTIDYLRLTGRDEQVQLVETYAKTAGLWADALKTPSTSACCSSTCPAWCATWPARPTRTSACRPPTGRPRHRRQVGRSAGPDARWRGDHRRHHQLHQHQQPAQRDRRRPAGAQRQRAGLTRKPWVKSSLAPGSKAVELYLEEAGLLPELEKLGFGIVAFACTTCNGMSGALDPKIQQEIIDRDLYATAVLSGNRNFDGRIHPYAKQAFLASPPLVVAYAIAGTIRFDIEKDVLGRCRRQAGPPEGHLAERRRDRRRGQASVKPEQFRKVYEPMFALRGHGRVSPLYDWRPQSTYIRRPPYWEGALAGERTLRGMRPLAVLPDNITTDHLSPSNAILLDSAAGEYLAKMGLPEEDFNSYATHRGDHLTAQRATFANPKLFNEMAVVDGAVKQVRWRASSRKAR
jgi:aconitate hydratase